MEEESSEEIPDSESEEEVIPTEDESEGTFSVKLNWTPTNREIFDTYYM